MIILGIDLSGPTNTADTCLAAFETRENKLILRDARLGADDRLILETISSCTGDRVVIGIDAPLSYQPGGGDRPADRELRRKIKDKGGAAGVMAPTMTRMAYLTLRGVALTRLLEALKPDLDLRIVEVHPGAVMLLRGAPSRDVAGFKRDPRARRRLLAWLAGHGLRNLPDGRTISDHCVAACAAALGAWDWAAGRSAWTCAAQPPFHPYDFAC